MRRFIRRDRVAFGQVVATRSSSDRDVGALTGSPEICWLAVRISTRVEAMGLLGPTPQRRPSEPTFVEALHALEGSGVARRHVRAVLEGTITPDLLRSIDDAIVSSPLPETEWNSMTAVFTEEALALLVRASVTSVGRYRRHERPTPDAVAARLHFLALVVADLAGCYNDRGVRRWFSRPRPQLDGQAPEELLVANWDPDEPGPRQVAALAATLVGAAGAT